MSPQLFALDGDRAVDLRRDRAQDRLESEWPGAANDNADDDQPLDRISLAIVVLALTSFWLGLGALLAICWGAQ
jgi:hypothetical protein